MMKTLAVSLLIVFGVTAADAKTLNDAVRQETIYKTVCVKGWTSTVRPPVNYTNRVKRDKLFAIGLKSQDARFYELDHIVPLALGGATKDNDNLQLQRWPKAKEKDRVEICLYRAVCRGVISLDEARKQILSNWRATSCPVWGF